MKEELEKALVKDRIISFLESSNNISEDDSYKKIAELLGGKNTPESLKKYYPCHFMNDNVKARVANFVFTMQEGWNEIRSDLKKVGLDISLTEKEKELLDEYFGQFGSLGDNDD